MKLKYFVSLAVTLSFLGQHSYAQMQPPAQPQYETCGTIEVDNGNGGTYQQQDHACLSRNSIKSRDYNAAVDAYNRGTQIITSDSGGMKEPTKPQYETCNQNSNGGEDAGYDYGCVSRNQAKEREYNIQMSGYNEAKTQEAKAKAEATSAEQKALAEQKERDSAKAAMEEAQQKNKKGSQIYQIASMACGVASGVYAAKFAASCSGGATCQYPLLAKSIAFAIFAGMAAKQAKSHDSVAHSACESANRVATNAADCGATPPPYNPDTFPNQQVIGLNETFGQDGKCKVSQEQCDAILAALPPGTNIKEALGGLSKFGSSKAPFKVNADGSITKNGKKYTAANFASEKDMIAAGMSANDAKAFMADLNKLNAGSSAALNAKAALAEENTGITGTFGDAGGTGNMSKGNGMNANGSVGNAKLMEGTGREPASAEGLVKDFNGELIGVAGDDIFKMMNRRYKLKTAQDSFIGP